MFGIDDAVAGALIGAAGNVIGGIFGSSGQKDANRTNLEIARQQMAFQERMSNTAWQRGVADMRKAGINPMLAVSQGGASAPQGASATMQNVQEPMSRAFSSAAAVLRTKLELQNLQQQNINLVKQNKKIDSDIDVNNANVAVSHSQAGNINANTARTIATTEGEKVKGDLWKTVGRFISPATSEIRKNIPTSVHSSKSIMDMTDDLVRHFQRKRVSK